MNTQKYLLAALVATALLAGGCANSEPRDYSRNDTRDHGYSSVPSRSDCAEYGVVEQIDVVKTGHRGVGAGAAIGVAAGVGLAQLGRKLRGQDTGNDLVYGFLGLGLIGAVYGVSVLVGAWGFLAVFFAAVALRQTETRLAERDAHFAPVLAAIAEVEVVDEALPPSVSEGSLVFKEHLERLSEVMRVLLIGGTLFQSSWGWRGIGLALFVFLVARPVSVLIALAVTRADSSIRWMSAWFGVRGIGSLYT
jgi:NhaP-type Na+/H+ or K+/H+ antiporter